MDLCPNLGSHSLNERHGFTGRPDDVHPATSLRIELLLILVQTLTTVLALGVLDLNEPPSVKNLNQ